MIPWINSSWDRRKLVCYTQPDGTRRCRKRKSGKSKVQYLASLTDSLTGLHKTDFIDSLVTVLKSSLPLAFTVTNTSIGPYDHAVWTVPINTTISTNTSTTLTGTWNPSAGTKTLTFMITLYDISNNIVGTRTVSYPRNVLLPAFTDNIGYRTTDFTSTTFIYPYPATVSTLALPWTFTLNNSTTGTYYNSVWTVPTNTTVVTNTPSTFVGIWNPPTGSTTLTFQLTLYDEDENVIGTRTGNYPVTVSNPPFLPSHSIYNFPKGAPDPKWTIVSAPIGAVPTTPYPAVSLASYGYIRYIGSTLGYYSFQTTFDLTGYNITTGTVMLRLGVDWAYGGPTGPTGPFYPKTILLNGDTIGSGTNMDYFVAKNSGSNILSGQGYPSPWNSGGNNLGSTYTASFVEGINTLTLVVQNTGNGIWIKECSLTSI